MAAIALEYRASYDEVMDMLELVDEALQDMSVHYELKVKPGDEPVFALYSDDAWSPEVPVLEMSLEDISQAVAHKAITLRLYESFDDLSDGDLFVEKCRRIMFGEDSLRSLNQDEAITIFMGDYLDAIYENDAQIRADLEFSCSG